MAGEPFPSRRPQVPLLQKLAQGVAKAHTLVRSAPLEVLPAIGANEKDITVRSATQRHRHLSEATSIDTAFLDTAFMDAVTSGAEGNAW